MNTNKYVAGEYMYEGDIVEIGVDKKIYRIRTKVEITRDNLLDAWGSFPGASSGFEDSPLFLHICKKLGL